MIQEGLLRFFKILLSVLCLFPAMAWSLTSHQAVRHQTAFFCEELLLRVDLGRTSENKAELWFDMLRSRQQVNGEMVFELIENGYFKRELSEGHQTQEFYISVDGKYRIEFWQKESGVRGFSLWMMEDAKEVRFVQEDDLDEGSPWWSLPVH